MNEIRRELLLLHQLLSIVAFASASEGKATHIIRLGDALFLDYTHGQTF
jgi:hypothetical protein